MAIVHNDWPRAGVPNRKTAVLNDEQVIEYRRLYDSGATYAEAMSRGMPRVTHSQYSKIGKRKAWASV